MRNSVKRQTRELRKRKQRHYQQRHKKHPKLYDVITNGCPECKEEMAFDRVPHTKYVFKGICYTCKKIQTRRLK